MFLAAFFIYKIVRLKYPTGIVPTFAFWAILFALTVFLNSSMSIIFAFYFPQYFFVPIIVGLVSLFNYWPFLFGKQVIPLSMLAFVLAGIIVLLLRHFILTLQSPQSD